MEIVEATVQHLPHLRMLFAAMVAEHPVAYPVTDDGELDNFTLAVYRQLQQNPTFKIFLARGEHGEPLGFVGGEIGERAAGKPRQIVMAHWLYVIPEQRHQGLAGALITAGAAWLQTHHPDVTHLEFFGNADDDGWKRRGFTPLLIRYYAPLAQLVALQNGHDRAAPTRPTAPSVPRPRRQPKRRRVPRMEEAH